MKECISTLDPPNPARSCAVKLNSLIFVSGQVGIDPGDGSIAIGDIEHQTRRALKNIERVLSSAGVGTDSILKTTMFITDMNDYSAVNIVCSNFFNGTPPASSCVQVLKLPHKEALIQVEAIAYADR